MRISDNDAMRLLSEAQELLVHSCTLQETSLIEWDLGRTGNYSLLKRKSAAARKKASAILRKLGFPMHMEITADMDMLSKEQLEAQTKFGAHLLERYLRLTLVTDQIGPSPHQRRAS